MSVAPAAIIPAPGGDNDSRTLALLADLSQALAESIDLEQTLAESARRIALHMHAEAAAVFLLDKDKLHLECRACAGPVDILGLRLPVGTGVVGRTLAENSGQIVNNTQHDPDAMHSIDKKTGFRTRSILSAPLATARGPIGVVEVINKRDGGEFDSHDLDVLRLLAAPTALAVRNAHMALALVEQQRIKRELEMARRLQKSLFPKRRRGKFPLLGINLPANEISGDFYDYFDLPDGRIAFVIGDVSGKGLNAAFLMVRTASLLRWAGKDGLAPAEWLARVNVEVCSAVNEGMFVCALVGQYDPVTRQAIFASAGFPPALLYRHGAFEEFGADGPPLGILDNSAYEQREVALGQDSLYFFSDGATDVRDADRNTIGEAGLRTLISRYASLPPAPRLRAVVAELQRLHLIDDTTVLLLEEPAPEQRSLLSFSLPARAENLYQLRVALRAALDENGIERDLRDKLVLAVDEAAANILRHAYRGTGQGEIIFNLTREPGGLRFELSDQAPPVDVACIKPRDLSECRPGGLGVNFIDALMDEWFIETLPRRCGNRLTMRKKLTLTPGDKE